MPAWSLGVDSSSSCTAVCLVDQDRGIVHMQHALTPGDELERMEQLQELFAAVPWKPDAIVLEAAAMLYGTGTTAKTLTKLHRANAVANVLLYQTFRLRPHIVAPSSSRKWLGLTKGIDLPVKEQVFLEATQQHMPGYTVTYKKSKKSPPPPKDFHYDEVDAFVLAVHGLSLLDVVGTT